MTVITIEKARVFDDAVVGEPTQLTLEGSPGNIISNQSPPHTIVDGTGCTLIPGLIDSNVIVDSSTTALSTLAMFGVTTVIDSSSNSAEVEAMRRFASQNPALPSFLTTGPVVAGSEADSTALFPYRSITRLTTPAAVEKFFARQMSELRAADFVKVITDVPGLDDKTLAAVVDAAHRHGKLAIAHSSQTRAYQRALDAGFDVVMPVPMDGSLDANTIQGFAENKIAVVPTLCYLRNASHSAGRHDDFSFAMDAVQKLHAAGVRICTGTSSNKADRMNVAFGESLHEELQLLVEAGLSNSEALRAATSVPAEVFRLHDRGSLEQGRRADVVLIEGNPLEEITAIKRIRKVWIRGVEVPGTKR